MTSTLTHQELEASILSANPRGLVGTSLGARVSKRAFHRYQEAIPAPSLIENLMPAMVHVAQPVLNGKIKTLGNMVCLDSGEEITAVDSNFMVPTSRGVGVHAQKVMQILDGGYGMMTQNETNPTRIRLGSGASATRSLLDWSEDLSNPGILKGVRGQELNGDKVQALIAKTRKPEELLQVKKGFPRTFALLGINKALNLSFDEGRALVYTKDKVVAVSEMEAALHPEKIERTMRDAKRPTVARDGFDI